MVDDYVRMDSIAILEVIIETLLGFEIVDEKDQAKDMQQYAMERWKYKMLYDENNSHAV